MAAAWAFAGVAAADPNVVSIQVQIPDFSSIMQASQENAASTFAVNGVEPSVMLRMPETMSDTDRTIVLYSHVNTPMSVRFDPTGNGAEMAPQELLETRLQHYVRRTFELADGLDTIETDDHFAHVVISAH